MVGLQTMSCKRILVTGSEGLIGKRIRKDLSQEYDIVGLDLQNGDDLTDEAFVEEWFKDNKLDGMILCHAFNPLPLKNTSKKEPHNEDLGNIRDYFEVNVVSAFNLCCNFIKNNNSGSIVSVSSLYGLSSPKHRIYNNFTKPIGYSLSKSSIILMTKYLASYYAPKYRFNTVVLGGIYDSRFDPDFVEKYNDNVPFDRMMNVDEATGIFDFLLGDKSSYATGAVFTIDGGWTAW